MQTLATCAQPLLEIESIEITKKYQSTSVNFQSGMAFQPSFSHKRERGAITNRALPESNGATQNNKCLPKSKQLLLEIPEVQSIWIRRTCVCSNSTKDSLICSSMSIKHNSAYSRIRSSLSVARSSRRSRAISRSSFAKPWNSKAYLSFYKWH